MIKLKIGHSILIIKGNTKGKMGKIKSFSQNKKKIKIDNFEYISKQKNFISISNIKKID